MQQEQIFLPILVYLEYIKKELHRKVKEEREEWFRIEKDRQALRRRTRAQRGRGIGSFFKKAYKLGKRTLNSRLGKRIARAAISEVPDVLENLGGKVKNKRLKKILTSDLAKTGADYATGLALEKLQ